MLGSFAQSFAQWKWSEVEIMPTGLLENCSCTQNSSMHLHFWFLCLNLHTPWMGRRRRRWEYWYILGSLPGGTSHHRLVRGHTVPVNFNKGERCFWINFIQIVCFQGKEYSVDQETATAKESSLFGTNRYWLLGIVCTGEPTDCAHTWPWAPGPTLLWQILGDPGLPAVAAAPAGWLAQSFLLSCHGLLPLKGSFQSKRLRVWVWRVVDIEDHIDFQNSRML